MSKNSGITGKTPWQAARAEAAQIRDADRAERTPEEQLELLDTRPGASVKERARLAHKVPPTG